MIWIAKAPTYTNFAFFVIILPAMNVLYNYHICEYPYTYLTAVSLDYFLPHIIFIHQLKANLFYECSQLSVWLFLVKADERFEP